MSILKEFVQEILFDALDHSIKKVEINKEHCNFYYQYRYDTELFLTFYIHAELIIIQDLEQSFSIKEFIDLDLDRSPYAGLQNKEFISFLQDKLDVFVNRKHVDYFSDDSIIKEILVLEEKNERLEKELEKFMNKKMNNKRKSKLKIVIDGLKEILEDNDFVNDYPNSAEMVFNAKTEFEIEFEQMEEIVKNEKN